MKIPQNPDQPAARETIFVFLLLFVSSFKDDSATIAASEFWSELTLHPAVQILKSHSGYALVPLAVLVALGVLTARRIVLRSPGLTAHMLAMSLYAAIRSLFYDVSAGSKVLLGFLILLIVWMFSILATSAIGAARYRVSLCCGLVAFSVFLVLCNFLNFHYGYGFVPGNARLFGTASHPNFLGAQLALANIALLASLLSNRYPLRIIMACILGFGILLLIYTGSRTGLLMWASGSVLYLSARRLFAIGRNAGLFVIAIVAGFFIYACLDDFAYMDGFERGYSADTRSAAWSYLADAINAHPLIGRGHFAGFTESSYLRGWATYGILYFVMLVGLVARLLIRMCRAVRNGKEPGFALLFGVSGALATGGVFEGYLVDVFSLPLVVFFLVCSAAVGVKADRLVRVRDGQRRSDPSCAVAG